MYCAVYKSDKKAETYLFIEKKDDFSPVPETLLTMFGHPKLVMVLDLDKRMTLARLSTAEIKKHLLNQGYYLQLPPPAVNMLDEHKQNKKKYE
ncbi:YcgL domain-containing protein [Thaumasiovibrio sp. DFM-14]|uniref:YcgL domain-containing protein n=1 Tax=Thaumasiovibrio sp. DFM-14 TaxID=3384792 RepID=UPI0039A125E1